MLKLAPVDVTHYKYGAESCKIKKGGWGGGWIQRGTKLKHQRLPSQHWHGAMTSAACRTLRKPSGLGGLHGHHEAQGPIRWSEMAWRKPKLFSSPLPLANTYFALQREATITFFPATITEADSAHLIRVNTFLQSVSHTVLMATRYPPRPALSM